VAAVESGDERANTALEFIRQLYAIERELPPLLGPADDPATPEANVGNGRSSVVRRGSGDATPVLAALKMWLDQTRSSALPKSPLGTAIGYASNNWTALNRYLEQGYLAIDNNLSERNAPGGSHSAATTGASWAARPAVRRRRCCTRSWPRASTWDSTRSHISAKRCRGYSALGETPTAASHCSTGSRIAGC